MGKETGIAWCDSTWNPVWGCTRVDDLCTNCYAEAIDKRMSGGHWGPRPLFREFGDAHWNEPLKWNREPRLGDRRRVFCASMTDVFHEHMPLRITARLWALIRATQNLDWLLLTKRAHRIVTGVPADWGDGWPNVWLGTSVGTDSGRHRIDELREVPAVVRFLSVEPLLEPLPKLDLRRIDWVIVGAESGPKHRPMEIDWVRDIRDQTKEAGAAFFLKQYVMPNGRKVETPELDGRRWTEFPRGGYSWQRTATNT